MKKILYVLLLVLFAAGTFLAGAWYNQHKTSASTHASALKPLYYVDPMHPAYKSDKPGIAPDCGMQLEPVYADSVLATAGPGNVPSSTGAVRIDPAKQQLFGVRVDSGGEDLPAHTSFACSAGSLPTKQTSTSSTRELRVSFRKSPLPPQAALSIRTRCWPRSLPPWPP